MKLPLIKSKYFKAIAILLTITSTVLIFNNFNINHSNNIFEIVNEKPDNTKCDSKNGKCTGKGIRSVKGWFLYIS